MTAVRMHRESTMLARRVEPVNSFVEEHKLSWVDHRASVGAASRRSERGDDVPTCPECGCELDVQPVPHSPRCKASTKPAAIQVKLCSEDGCDEPAIGLFCAEHGEARRQRWGKTPIAPRAELEEAGSSAADVDGTAGTAGAAHGLHESVGERQGRQPASSSSNGRAVPTWTAEVVLGLIRLWAEQHDGQTPTSLEWSLGDRAWPTASSCVRLFGSWGSAIEAAGFPKPTRGRRKKTGPAAPPRLSSASRRHPEAKTSENVPSLPPRAVPEAAAESRASGGASTTGWIKVKGTGLIYRSPDEAYVAAAEIEADGERVADGARHDGNEAKAEQAIDASRELAEKIRAAARGAEEKRAPLDEAPVAGQAGAGASSSGPAEEGTAASGPGGRGKGLPDAGVVGGPLDLGPAVVSWVRATRGLLDALEDVFSANERKGEAPLRLIVRPLEDDA